MRIKARHRLAALALCATASCAQAQAPLFRAYLSVTGADTNPCTLAAPCRLLPRAISVVQPGGEVWMLDSGNFNSTTVTVDRGVTILSIPGAEGSVVGNNGSALAIATSAPVALRNVTLLPLAGTSAPDGIVKAGPGRLVLQDCNLAGFSFSGLRASGAADVSVFRSVFRDNGAAIVAIDGATLWVADSTFVNNANRGIFATAQADRTITRATLVRSSVRGSSNAVVGAALSDTAKVELNVAENHLEGLGPFLPGVEMSAVAGGAVEGAVTGNTVSRFSHGISFVAQAPSRLTVAGNRLSGNDVGLKIGGTGQAFSSGTNFVQGNATNLEVTGVLATPGGT